MKACTSHETAKDHRSKNNCKTLQINANHSSLQEDSGGD
jgi:hypothetical protein